MSILGIRSSNTILPSLTCYYCDFIITNVNMKIDKVPLPEVLRNVYEYVSPPRTLSLLKVC